MAAQPCSVCGQTTYRADGICDGCWKARQVIEESVGRRELDALIEAMEEDWQLMDRIDWDQRHK